MVIFEVGQPYPPVAGKPEGVYFEIDEAGAKLIYNFASPSAREIASTREGSSFEIRFLELGDLLWITVKAGSIPWADAPYNPRLSMVEELPTPEPGLGLALTMILVDANTAVIRSLRLIGLGKAFSQSLLHSASALRGTPMTLAQQQLAIANVQLRYTTQQLADMAAVRWRLRT